MKYFISALLLTSGLVLAPVMSAQTSTGSDSETTRGQGMGAPSEESLSACAGAAESDSCTFSTDRGEREGVCSPVRDSDALVCRGARQGGGQGGGMGRGQGGGQGGGMGRGQDGGMGAPSEESLSACAGAAESDSCTFSTDRGEREGVCSPVRDSDALVCRGARQGGGQGGGMGRGQDGGMGSAEED